MGDVIELNSLGGHFLPLAGLIGLLVSSSHTPFIEASPVMISSSASNSFDLTPVSSAIVAGGGGFDSTSSSNISYLFEIWRLKQLTISFYMLVVLAGVLLSLAVLLSYNLVRARSLDGEEEYVEVETEALKFY